MIDDTNGLYLRGQWVMSADRISTNYQSNDLTKPGTQEANFSREFTVPYTVTMCRLLEHTEQIDSTSKLPYRLLPAYLIDGGELLFDGVARLSAFSDGWEVELIDAKADLFTRLDRSIRSLDLSRYDHTWSVETMNRLATAIDGACYPLIDYGLLSEGKLPADSLFPALFMRTIVGQMLKEEDYTLVGNLPDDALYQALAIPFVESEPTAQDEEWKVARTSIVSWDPGYDDHISGRQLIDRIQPYSIDNRPLNALSQGRLKNYDVTSCEYVCDTSMRVQVQASQILKISCTGGSAEVYLLVEKNGQEVASNGFSTGSGYNILFMRTDTVSVDTTVNCQAGDRLRVRLRVNRQTRLGGWKAEVYNNPDNARASYTPKIELATEGNWIVSRNLPDISCQRILLNLAYLYSGTWQIDSLRHQIRLVRLNDTVFSTDYVDWSRRIDTSQRPRLLWHVEGYAQRNQLKWKQNEETQKGEDGLALSIPYGDGLITVDSTAIDPQVDLFEMEFAASINSTAEIPNYGRPLLIRTRTVSGTGQNQTVNQQAATPRLILIHPTRTDSVRVTRLAADGETIEELSVSLKPCWFGTRPLAVVGRDTAFSLCFSPVSGNRGEHSLIERHYEGLGWVLRRMRVLTLGMRLYANDIAQHDFAKPIQLKQVELGAQIISNSTWYLNKINDYSSDGKCTVTLVGF